MATHRIYLEDLLDFLNANIGNSNLRELTSEEVRLALEALEPYYSALEEVAYAPLAEYERVVRDMGIDRKVVEVEYSFTPGTSPSRMHPGDAPEFEVLGVALDGREIRGPGGDALCDFIEVYADILMEL